MMWKAVLIPLALLTTGCTHLVYPGIPRPMAAGYFRPVALAQSPLWRWDNVMRLPPSSTIDVLSTSGTASVGKFTSADAQSVTLKVKAGDLRISRAEILRIGDIFRAKVVDVTPTTYTLEATGEEGKIEAIIDLLRPFGIQEVVRTGKVAIARSSKNRVRKVEEKLGKRPGPPRPQSQDPKVVGFAD
jgi:hypothetical protein